ncbi:hypothetical protein HYPSUDRAFT_203475 [Hypholoma sublateritium FD-334 SS-4]|uniref:Uncharacterized protein n=1 Tax=Hypholoma sublateritium (strain FD-334 SS-4) TaxID=945553 RepID=A0A0D2PLV5_HYPSF|nr:hypothetical protein HYPSUDRAFT_203475 [Hypholoma sublateritium FD-334 SS-4]
MIVETEDLSSESSLSWSPSSASSVDSILPTTRNMPKDELHRCVSRIRADYFNGGNIEFPELDTIDELNKWISKLEIALQASGIMAHQWSDAVIIFMAGSSKINMAMRLLRESRNKEGLLEWNWDDFKGDLRETLAAIRSEPSAIKKFQQEHPTASTAVKVALGTGMVIGGTTVLAPAIVVGALNAVGFTASGVVGSSIAATIQSSFYGGATTGLFSLCQSLGTVAVTSSATSLTAAAGTIAAGTSLLRSADGGDKSSPQAPIINAAASDSNSSQSPPPYCG